MIAMRGDKDILIARYYPDGHWLVPGGLCESGETLEDCARREWQEECGVPAPAKVWLFDDKLGTTYYVGMSDADSASMRSNLYDGVHPEVHHHRWVAASKAIRMVGLPLDWVTDLENW